MSESTIQIEIAVADRPQPADTRLGTFVTIGHIVSVASLAIRGSLLAPLRQLWTNYYPRVAFGEEGVTMPHSALAFIISALIALAEIKSQGVPGFPFQTHPRLIMFSVTTLLIFGLASAAELVISAAGLDPTSVYAITAHLGKIVSLCILVASLASLFYI